MRKIPAIELGTFFHNIAQRVHLCPDVFKIGIYLHSNCSNMNHSDKHHTLISFLLTNGLWVVDTFHTKEIRVTLTAFCCFRYGLMNLPRFETCCEAL